MFSKIASFFKGFFGNITADPMSSAKGLVQLAAAGAACYGMATGAVPINIGAPMAASFAASGVHALGTNSTGVTDPAAVKAEGLIQSAAVMVPTAMSVVDQISAMKSAADEGQAKVSAFQAVTAALAPVLAQPAAEGADK